ncbi:hypothetical protein BIWAKO_01721 [Bosea sp. BIWAKO-01]|nr:hypothetical protein BIWAKO_01721 [Bosea sp. BIWAKO-01]
MASGTLERICYGIAAALTGIRFATYRLATNIPGLAAVAERRLVVIVRKQLAAWGHAHSTTDASAHRPAAT